MNPRIIPNTIDNNANSKMFWIVAKSGIIFEANSTAKIPVAPKEKSILPELRLEFNARAASRVNVIVLMNVIIFFTHPRVSPGTMNI